MNELSTLPPTTLAVRGVFLLVQFGLQIAAFVSLARTPADRLTLGGRRWAWALIILMGELIGAIVYFVAGRLPAPAAEQAQAVPASDRAGAAADALYGAAAPAAPTASSKAPGNAVTDNAADVGADGTGMGELP